MNSNLPHYTTAGLDELGEGLGRLRLCDPAAQQRMERSLVDHGQIAPVLVRERGSTHEVLDGFKRLRAARSLQWPRLQVAVVRASEAQAKLQLVLGRDLAGANIPPPASPPRGRSAASTSGSAADAVPVIVGARGRRRRQRRRPVR